MRTICSTRTTKIFPSPILPVRAAFVIASTTGSTSSVRDDDFELDLGEKVDDVLGALIEFGVSLLAPESLDLGDGQTLDAEQTQGFLHLI